MSMIDTQNGRPVRDSMQIFVKVEATINGETVAFEYTNEDILSVELNLRSDLTPIDPTLPESEIVVQVYCPEDVSDTVKLIADDEPLTYWAGYAGDYSPVRRFYISEPVTWADKVLTYKAVDAVHFLDRDVKPFWTSTYYTQTGTSTPTACSFGASSQSYGDGAARDICGALVQMVHDSGVDIINYDAGLPDFGADQAPVLDQFNLYEAQNTRDAIANIMNLARVEFPAGVFNEGSFWLSYIDAGIPTFNRLKPVSKWDIYAEDCGDIKENTARDIVKIEAVNKTIQPSDYDRSRGIKNAKIGSLSITKNVGASLSLDTYTMFCDAIAVGSSTYTLRVIALGSAQQAPVDVKYYPDFVYTFGKYCYNADGFMQWNSALSSFWTSLRNGGVIDASTTDVSVDVYGEALTVNDAPATYTKTGTGETVTASKTSWCGKMYMYKSSVVYKTLPDNGFKQLLNRSNKTGSFTWKGDPRIQPRDVFTWHELDGTTELRTIETINIKHEGGGTVAEITYRKGIV